MSFLEVFLLAIGLSMDCFAVAISFGSRKIFSTKDILKMALFFGFFQGFMPFIGWILGGRLRVLIESADHWVAFGLLWAIGLRMVFQALQKGEIVKKTDIRDLRVLITLSVATSIDALVMGVTFGVVSVNIFKVVFLISVVTFAISVFGAKLGEKTSIIPPKKAELIGGIVLLIIGLNILVKHLMLQ